MLRSIVCTACILAARASTAWAAAPDLSQANCESPQIMAFMEAHLGKGQLTATGAAARNRFSYGPILSATTEANTGRQISCEISVDVTVAGKTQRVRGRGTIEFGAGSNWSWRWAPGA